MPMDEKFWPEGEQKDVKNFQSLLKPDTSINPCWKADFS